MTVFELYEIKSNTNQIQKPLFMSTSFLQKLKMSYHRFATFSAVDFRRRQMANSNWHPLSDIMLSLFNATCHQSSATLQPHSMLFIEGGRCHLEWALEYLRQPQAILISHPYFNNSDERRQCDGLMFSSGRIMKMVSQIVRYEWGGCHPMQMPDDFWDATTWSDRGIY